MFQQVPKADAGTPVWNNDKNNLQRQPNFFPSNQYFFHWFKRVIFPCGKFEDNKIIITPIIVMKDPQNMIQNQMMLNGQDVKYFLKPNIGQVGMVRNLIPYNIQG